MTARIALFRAIAPALAYNPVTNQVLIHPDDVVILIFLPANDQIAKTRRD